MHLKSEMRVQHQYVPRGATQVSLTIQQYDSQVDCLIRQPSGVMEVEQREGKGRRVEIEMVDVELAQRGKQQATHPCPYPVTRQTTRPQRP